MSGEENNSVSAQTLTVLLVCTLLVGFLKNRQHAVLLPQEACYKIDYLLVYFKVIGRGWYMLLLECIVHSKKQQQYTQKINHTTEIKKIKQD